MDWNQRKREVEERLWNLRVRDEDLLKKMERVLENQQKMDMILEKLQNQDRMEQQIDAILKRQDHIEAELRNVVTEVTNSKEMLKIIDTVETTEGYSELFVKDFDRIHAEIEEMGERIKEVSETQLKMKNEHMELVGKIENGDLASKTEKIMSEIENIKEFMPEPTFHCINTDCNFSFSKIALLREDGVSIECPKCKWMQTVGKLTKGNRWMLAYGCNHYQQFPCEREPEDNEKCGICGMETLIYEPTLDCHKCKSLLSRYLQPPREDGVSIICRNSKCKAPNMVGRLKDGHKWMFGCNCGHYQQFPADKEQGEREKCQVCGVQTFLYGLLLNCQHCERSFYETRSVPREDGCFECSSCNKINLVGNLKQDCRWMFGCNCGHYQQFPADKEQGEREKCQVCGVQTFLYELTLNCQHCNRSFYETCSIAREDGCFECSNCKIFNIVGNLKTNYRWMFTYLCVHFQQFPIEKEPGTMEKCQICEQMTQIQDPALKCQYCKISFHGIPREDGCFECSNCKKLNLVGNLKQGHRWMRPEGCKHFQQFPLNIKEGDVQQCQICGNSDRVELVLKCWNFECSTLLDENLPLREDGVSVQCSKSECEQLNIIGTLTEGKKWMRNNWCVHFLQVPLNKKEREKEKCPFCGEDGTLYEGNRFVSLPY